jgi:uncharacterized protein YceK
MTMRPNVLRCVVILLAGTAVVSGCAGVRQTERPPDEQFGHRYEGRASDGRETIVISAPEADVDFVYYPATLDTVHVRQAVPVSPDAATTQVEVLIKGAFPDACTQLHSVDQQRAEHILNVTLDMRRPRGVLCASVVRPYRFYLLLDGLYEPGHYSLKINGTSHPFVVAPLDR